MHVNCEKQLANCNNLQACGTDCWIVTICPVDCYNPEIARSKGRVALTTNMVMGGTVTDDASDEWLVLDQKVNSYPTDRGFTAIGTGGDDFVQSMVVSVESVLQESIPKGRVSQKLSSRGKYVSVNIGPIRVVSSEQVQAVYRAMRRDNRMKYFL
ncbi:unnamed protein product [Miscanthus lutarioriparius]|uniref:Uncharacterized protein n=1 Tax=Miscanthus lutarioriparius TaxID=422564 RepID=A0A811QZW3_9POAL|nr:unnamed protein product [Miscanthus lutarioriparius]